MILQDGLIHRLVVRRAVAELDIVNQLCHGGVLAADGTVLLLAAKLHRAEHGVAHAAKDQEAGLIQRGCS